MGAELRIGTGLPGPGRPKGSQDKVTREAKEMISEALHRAGEITQKKQRSLKDMEPGAAYLAEQAHKNPVAFMSLVGKLVPQKIDMDVQIMSTQMVELLGRRREQLAGLRTIEHEPAKEETHDPE